MNETPPAQTQPSEAVVTERLKSLDAYRGLIMVTLAFGGFGLAATAGLQLQGNPESAFWKVVQHQCVHAQWAGCRYWDMIQPSFMFMVGVSMAYSYAKRRRIGHSYARMLSHASWRSLVLIFLGVFLSSNGQRAINWTFANVLCQIGLGYCFLFLLWRRSFRTQAVAAAALLVATWLLYVAYPGKGIDIEVGAPEVGVAADWAREHLQNVGMTWHKNANVGHAIDTWFLNLFPRAEAFEFNRGGYPTINFIPAIVTMLFGLMCGELLRSDRSGRRKIKILLIAGFCGLAVGQLLHLTGLCPVVKRIWTPAWALFSAGWCCLILATLYAVVDVLKCHRWTFPLTVVGVNSIAMYCMSHQLKPWVGRTLKMFLGRDVFQILGEGYAPMVQSTMIGLALWLVCYWLYRRKMFIRI
ncbi:MAG: acyltransferase family protein [Planctomycetota bacterium]|jgi:predicted acyltransferase